MIRLRREPVELSWVLVGAPSEAGWWTRACRRSRGGPAQVEADWRWAFEREETHGDLAGFLHTHPGGSGVAPSERDRRTMQAWCSALGKPLLCIIREGRRTAAWLFQPRQDIPRQVALERAGRGVYRVLVKEEGI
jgi:proteasome lid subunit RPN8/RPN11